MHKQTTIVAYEGGLQKKMTLEWGTCMVHGHNLAYGERAAKMDLISSYFTFSLFLLIIDHVLRTEHIELLSYMIMLMN